ncbi:hypothetical protein GCM10023350_09300 [Nocardioides endophyticus]|uniref:SIR2-like domain-containing protein n=1 Tax=Nocardioides endophyticus TaxID=1353775 RepID=A0ABP8YF21_9ACTN
MRIPNHHGITFLLGAGASAEAGLPMSRGITQLMIDRLSDERWDRQAGYALNFVVSAIIADDGRSGHRPDELPDIERVASAIELLAGRSDLEISPFVASWEPALTALEAAPPREPMTLERNLVRTLTGQRPGSHAPAATEISGLLRQWSDAQTRRRSLPSSWSANFRKAVAPQPDGRELVKLLKQLIASQLPGQRSPVFFRLLELLITHLGDILDIDDDSKFDYLTPLVQLDLPPGVPLTIATLNYDLGVELVARRAGVEVSRGIEGWASSGLLNFTDAPVRLLKLHGSLDWERERRRSALAPRQSLVSDDSRTDRPFLVFGQREKLRAEGPFLQLLEAFRTALYSAETLIVLGYAFRDGHINECVAGWLAGDARRRLIVVDPYFPEFSGWGADADFRRDLLRWGEVATAGEQGMRRLDIRRESASQFLADIRDVGPRALLETAFAARESEEGEQRE